MHYSTFYTELSLINPLAPVLVPIVQCNRLGFKWPAHYLACYWPTTSVFIHLSQHYAAWWLQWSLSITGSHFCLGEVIKNTWLCKESESISLRVYCHSGLLNGDILKNWFKKEFVHEIWSFINFKGLPHKPGLLAHYEYEIFALVACSTVKVDSELSMFQNKLSVQSSGVKKLSQQVGN